MRGGAAGPRRSARGENISDFRFQIQDFGKFMNIGKFHMFLKSTTTRRAQWVRALGSACVSNLGQLWCWLQAGSNLVRLFTRPGEEGAFRDPLRGLTPGPPSQPSPHPSSPQTQHKATMAAALVGKEAPDFKITLIDGSETSLKALLALGKSVVIDFYTSWCANACSALGKPPTKQDARENSVRCHRCDRSRTHHDAYDQGVSFPRIPAGEP